MYITGSLWKITPKKHMAKLQNYNKFMNHGIMSIFFKVWYLSFYIYLKNMLESLIYIFMLINMTVFRFGGLVSPKVL